MFSQVLAAKLLADAEAQRGKKRRKVRGLARKDADFRGKRVKNNPKIMFFVYTKLTRG